MALFKSGNPAINEKVFNNITIASGEELMTVNGAMKKFGLMLVMVLGAASFTWGEFFKGGNVMPWAIGGAIGGFVLALVIIFKQSWAPYLSLGYALCQGLFLGAISAVLEASFGAKYPGLIMQAVLMTFGVAAGMFLLYYFRIIRVTNTFRKVLFTAMIAILLFYIVAFIINVTGGHFYYLQDSSPLAIGINLFVIVIAALRLMLDFDLIEKGAEQGAPKYFEWYGAFGLMVTMIWLYMNILRLLARIAGSRK
jgi:uncharacterized YccA/Bax inhibitor family protein